MIPESIANLHTAFVRLTGQDIALSMFREGQWATWLGFRREAPFTIADLAEVVSYLRREIRAGNRRAGALKFSNLIGNPDYFEEDLSLARSISRVRPAPDRTVRVPQPDGSATERRLPGDGAAAATRKAGEVIASPAFQNFLKLKETLNPKPL
jgi:hypothetical protein